MVGGGNLYADVARMAHNAYMVSLFFNGMYIGIFLFLMMFPIVPGCIATLD